MHPNAHSYGVGCNCVNDNIYSHASIEGEYLLSSYEDSNGEEDGRSLSKRIETIDRIMVHWIFTKILPEIPFTTPNHNLLQFWNILKGDPSEAPKYQNVTFRGKILCQTYWEYILWHFGQFP